MKTDISNMGDAIWNEINKWQLDTTIKLSDSVLDTSIEACDEIKKITPRNPDNVKGKIYRNCFTVKPNRSRNKTLMERQLWNTQYMLSHLIEDGHKVYTRLGKKTDPNAVKIGPLPIKKRSANNGGTFAVFGDNTRTVKYQNWYHTRQLAEEYLVKDIKNKLSK